LPQYDFSVFIHGFVTVLADYLRTVYYKLLNKAGAPYSKSCHTSKILVDEDSDIDGMLICTSHNLLITEK
jgi:hypothetical protein